MQCFLTHSMNLLTIHQQKLKLEVSSMTFKKNLKATNFLGYPNPEIDHQKYHLLLLVS